MSVRQLSPELQEKAKNELNEVPSRIQKDLTHLHEWISKQPHLNAKPDDQKLLTFLRGCNFSLEAAKQRIDSYYTAKTLVPEFFSNRDPLSPEIQEILKLGCFWIPLPKSPDPAAPRVLYIGNGLFNADSIRVADVMKVNLMIYDILMNEDDNFVVAGHHSFVDYKGLVLGHMMQLTPNFLIKAGKSFFDIYPTRPQTFHFMNLPSFFEMVLRPLIAEKSKVFLHTDVYLGNLHKFIPTSLLPKELGGENGTLNDLIVEWKNKVESYRDWFLEDMKYGSDESKRPGKPKTSGDMFGVDGSFRKLDID